MEPFPSFGFDIWSSFCILNRNSVSIVSRDHRVRRNSQTNAKQEFAVARLDRAANLFGTSKHLCPLVLLLCAQYLVLAVDAPLDLASLNELDNQLLEIVSRQAKSQGHAVEADRGEGLEIQNDRTVTDVLRKFLDMRAQDDVQRVPGRHAVQDLQHRLELAGYVSIDELADILLLLKEVGERRWLRRCACSLASARLSQAKAADDGGSRERCQSTKNAIDCNVSRRHELVV